MNRVNEVLWGVCEERVSKRELDETAAAMLDWLDGMRQFDATAEWAWTGFEPMFEAGEQVGYYPLRFAHLTIQQVNEPLDGTAQDEVALRHATVSKKGSPPLRVPTTGWAPWQPMEGWVCSSWSAPVAATRSQVRSWCNQSSP